MFNHRKVARLCSMGRLCVAAATAAPASAALDPNIKIVLGEPS